MYGFLQNLRKAEGNKIMQYFLRAPWLSVLKKQKYYFSEEIRARYVQRRSVQYDKCMGL